MFKYIIALILIANISVAFCIPTLPPGPSVKSATATISQTTTIPEPPPITPEPTRSPTPRPTFGPTPNLITPLPTSVPTHIPTTKPTLEPTAEPPLAPTPPPPKPEPSWIRQHKIAITSVISVALITVLGVVLGVFYYQKKRQTARTYSPSGNIQEPLIENSEGAQYLRQGYTLLKGNYQHRNEPELQIELTRGVNIYPETVGTQESLDYITLTKKYANIGKITSLVDLMVDAIMAFCDATGIHGFPTPEKIGAFVHHISTSEDNWQLTSTLQMPFTKIPHSNQQQEVSYFFCAITQWCADREAIQTAWQLYYQLNK